MTWPLLWMLRGSFQALQILIRLFRFAEVNVTNSLKRVLRGSNPNEPASFEFRGELYRYATQRRYLKKQDGLLSTV